MKHIIGFILFVSALIGWGGLSTAQEPPAAVIAAGLNTPWGIATFGNNVYVSESGAGQIVQINPGAAADKSAVPVITGFETKPFGKDYKLGPLGLAFLDKDNFIVGGGDLGQGSDLIRVFTLPPADKPLEKPLAVNDAKAKVGPIPKGDASATGEGQYFSIVSNGGSLFAMGQGDPAQGWVLKSDLTTEKKLSELKPFVAATKAGGIPGPFCLTLSKRGDLLIGGAGEFGKPGDSTITFCHGRTGKKLLHLTTDLNDLVDLSYSPKTGRLYALDFSASDPAHGGLYRIDDDGMDGAKTVKIISLDRPTSMAFTPDGTLYITILGVKGANGNPGQVLKCTGLEDKR